MVLVSGPAVSSVVPDIQANTAVGQTEDEVPRPRESSLVR